MEERGKLSLSFFEWKKKSWTRTHQKLPSNGIEMHEFFNLGERLRDVDEVVRRVHSHVVRLLPQYVICNYMPQHVRELRSGAGGRGCATE
jgi:hypothetical protein